MQINPYLTFNGQCEAAFTFYQRCLGGQIEIMLRHGETPMAGQTPADWLNKIMHAQLEIGGRILMGSDAPPDRYRAPQGFMVNLGIDDVQRAEQVFNAMAHNGSVRMPFQQTFWAHRFGMLDDQFGIAWSLNCQPVAAIGSA